MDTVYSITDPEGYLEPKLAKSGYGALSPLTVTERFKQTVELYGDCGALYLKRPSVDGVLPLEWKVWTWKDYYADCRAFAKSLISLDVKPFKIVNILGFNSPEWLISNCGAMFAGCIAAGIYATNTSEACQYVTEHSKAEILVVDGNKQLLKYTGLHKPLPHLKAIVVYGEAIDEGIMKKCSVPVYSWESFLLLGADIPDTICDEAVAGVKPGHCSTLIYTSGTTGPPKAVMLSHDNITWTSLRMREDYAGVHKDDRLLSYLPLSHIAAQMVDIHVPMSSGAKLYFAQPDALKGSLVASLKEAEPTLFFAVPRVWEKIQEKMVQTGRSNSKVKQSIAAWAKKVGAKKSAMAQFGAEGGTPWGYTLAKIIVFNNVKKALGLANTRCFYTGAAPIARETLDYFASLDVAIIETFGQSECTGPHSSAANNEWLVGTCGRPLRGSESKIDPVTGELSYRGRHIFMGYMYMPQETAATIDAEGFLHSGDVAEFDSNNTEYSPPPSGFLRITGRIKELIITAGGENVPPILIENEMKAAMNAVSNCMVIGDRRKYLIMLLSLKTEVDASTGAPTDVLAADALFVAKQIGSSATTVTEARADPLWNQYFDEGMKKANAKTTSSAQIVQKWTLLPVDFSENAGDLTPTLKLKRNVVAKKYEELIDSVYAADSEENSTPSVPKPAAVAAAVSTVQEPLKSEPNESDKEVARDEQTRVAEQTKTEGEESGVGAAVEEPAVTETADAPADIVAVVSSPPEVKTEQGEAAEVPVPVEPPAGALDGDDTTSRRV